MKRILIIGLLLPIIGCSAFNSRSIDQGTLSALQNKSMSLIIHEKPDFLAITPDKKMLTTAGFNAATLEGNRLIQEAGIYDPASQISRLTAQVISAENGIRYNESHVKKAKAKDAKSLSRLANGRDYVLSVETDAWLFTYNVKLANYHVRYIAKARLINANKAKTIWEDSCDYDTARAGQPLVNYGTLVGNNAAYIKESLEEAAAFCANKFSDDFRK